MIATREMRANLAISRLQNAQEDLEKALSLLGVSELSASLDAIDSLIVSAKKARRMIAQGK